MAGKLFKDFKVLGFYNTYLTLFRIFITPFLHRFYTNMKKAKITPISHLHKYSWYRCKMSVIILNKKNLNTFSSIIQSFFNNELDQITNYLPYFHHITNK